MPNVVPSDALRAELQAMDLVVWEAKRANKSSPTDVVLAGPDLDRMLYGHGATIEEAVAAALRSPYWLQRQPGLSGAMHRLENAMSDLWYRLWQIRDPHWTDLDDDIPF